MRFLLFVALAALLFREHFAAAYPVDDAYIYLQTARNVLLGQGWGFNPGEIVNACSSVLYILLQLTVAMILSPLLPLELSDLLLWQMTALQILCLALVATIIWQALDYLESIPRWTLTVVLAFHPIFLFASGMESALFVLMLVLSIALYLEQRWLLAGIALAGLTLTRPEGGLLVPILLLCAPPPDLRAWRLGLLGFLAPVLAWLVFSGWYFGALIPNSTLVKLQQAGTFSDAEGFFARFFRFTWSLPLTIGLALLGVGRGVSLARSARWFLPLLVIYGLVQGLAYGLAGARGGYFWYFVPAYLALTVLVYWGIEFLARKMAGYLLSPQRIVELRVRPVAGLGLILIAVSLVTSLGAIQPMPRYEYRNAREYLEISDWLQRNTPEHARVASLEIGYLGYHSRRYVVDPLGLVHLPEPGINGATAILAHRRPEIVIFPSAWLQPAMLERGDPDFREWLKQYEQRESFGRFDLLVKMDSGI
jgi:hypothetical protein